MLQLAGSEWFGLFLKLVEFYIQHISSNCMCGTYLWLLFSEKFNCKLCIATKKNVDLS